MAFVHGRKAKISIDAVMYSGISTDAGMSRSRDTAETSTLGTDDKSYVPGMKDSQLSLTYRFSRAEVTALEVIYEAGSEEVIVFYPEGNDAGSRTYTFTGIITQFDVNASTGDVVGGTMTIQRTGATVNSTV